MILHELYIKNKLKLVFSIYRLENTARPSLSVLSNFMLFYHSNSQEQLYSVSSVLVISNILANYLLIINYTLWFPWSGAEVRLLKHGSIMSVLWKNKCPSVLWFLSPHFNHSFIFNTFSIEKRYSYHLVPGLLVYFLNHLQVFHVYT